MLSFLTGLRPIAALVAGIYAKPRRVMGHAGAWAAPGDASAETKWKILENAGATMVDHPAKFGNVMKTILAQSGRDVNRIVSPFLKAQVFIFNIILANFCCEPATELSHLAKTKTNPGSKTGRCTRPPASIAPSSSRPICSAAHGLWDYSFIIAPFAQGFSTSLHHC